MYTYTSVIKLHLIHQTQTSEVRAQIIYIDNNNYIGLQRKYYSTEQFTERVKGVYLPVEAWEKFLKETLPLLNITV